MENLVKIAEGVLTAEKKSVKQSMKQLEILDAKKSLWL